LSACFVSDCKYTLMDCFASGCGCASIGIRSSPF